MLSGQSVSDHVEEASECCSNVKEIDGRTDDKKMHDEYVKEKTRGGLQFSDIKEFIECRRTWQYYKQHQ